MSELAAWEWICDWAREQGDLGRAWAPRGAAELAPLMKEVPGLRATQPFRPDYRALEAAAPGRVSPTALPGPFDTVLFVPSRQRTESLGLMAQSLATLAPGGRFVYSVVGDTVLTSDLTAQRQLGRLSLDHHITSMAVTPDGLHVVLGDESGRVHFLELDAGPAT